VYSGDISNTNPKEKIMQTITFTKIQLDAIISTIKKLEKEYDEAHQMARFIRQDLVTASSSSKTIKASQKPRLQESLDIHNRYIDKMFSQMEALREIAGLSWEEIWY
jgi:uncharacterized protein (UPF0335 family)